MFFFVFEALNFSLPEFLSLSALAKRQASTFAGARYKRVRSPRFLPVETCCELVQSPVVPFFATTSQVFRRTKKPTGKVSDTSFF